MSKRNGQSKQRTVNEALQHSKLSPRRIPTLQSYQVLSKARDRAREVLQHFLKGRYEFPNEMYRGYQPKGQEGDLDGEMPGDPPNRPPVGKK